MDTEDQAYRSGLPFAGNASMGSVQKDSEKTAGSSSQKSINKLFRGKLASSEAPDSRAGGIKLAEGRGFGSSVGMHAMTPTSRLAGQLDSITIARSTVGDGIKFSSLDSPTSDCTSSNFPSLTESDRGYVSMTSMPSFGKMYDKDYPATTQHPPLFQSSSSECSSGLNASKEDRQMEVDDGTNAYKGPMSKLAMAEEMNTVDEPIMEVRERERNSASPSHDPPLLSLPEVGSVVRGESPSAVPAIGENIEVMTDASSSALVISQQAKHESGGECGVLSKRSAGAVFDAEEPSRKNPRLSPEPLSGNFGSKNV